VKRCLLSLLLLLAGCREPVAQSTPTPPPPENVVVVAPDSPKFTQVKVEPVRAEDMPTAEVTAPGKVEANPNYISQVTLPVPGRVSQVLVRLGDSVQAGQPVLSVVGPDAGAAVAALRESQASLRENQATLQESMALQTESSAELLQAKAALTKARTAQRKAQIDHARVLDLFQHNAIAQKELLNAETDLRQATADVETAKAGIEQAKAGLNQSGAAVEQARAGIDQVEATVLQAEQRLRLLGVGAGQIDGSVIVHSPLSGKVLDIRVVAGEYHSDTGSPVMTIADLRSVWVTSNVPESMIRFISIGEIVHITLDAYPGKSWTGRVKHMADVLDARTRTLKVAIELHNPRGQFKPEMFGRIHHIQDVKKLPVVPLSAILQSDAGSYVFVEQERGRFEKRPVSTGQRSEGRVAILKGLGPGERVVADGAILLR